MTEKPVQKFVEELILIILILMNVFEFLGLLPGDVGFIKVVISMTALGYVLFKVSLSDIFFGTKNQNLDFALIFSYFLLIVNKFVEFSNMAKEDSQFLHDFFTFIVNNAELIEGVALIGAVACLLLSFK